MGIFDKKCSAQLFLVLIQSTLLTLSGCSKKEFQQTQNRQKQERFFSLTYNHFEAGVLFADVEMGLNVLWEASFINGRVYKENVGLFVPGGLLILPNKDNTRNSGRFVLPMQVKNKKLIVHFAGDTLRVLGIIHTHPEVYALRMPAPGTDYQYSYIGIHNYVIGFMDLFDAYKNSRGIEKYTRLGPRNAYHLLPFKISRPTVTENADFNKKVIPTNNEQDFSFLEQSRRTPPY